MHKKRLFFRVKGIAVYVRVKTARIECRGFIEPQNRGFCSHIIRKYHYSSIYSTWLMSCFYRRRLLLHLFMVYCCVQVRTVLTYWEKRNRAKAPAFHANVESAPVVSLASIVLILAAFCTLGTKPPLITSRACPMSDV